MIRFVDAHCHLDLYPDYDVVAREAAQNDTAVIAVTTLPAAWARNLELARSFPNVYPALGLHPQLVASHATEIDMFENLVKGATFVGEVGLDATSRYYPSFDRQKLIFHRVLAACAIAGGKALSVHSVRTVKTVLDMVEESGVIASGCKVILHWFTGSRNEALRATSLGCYFSVNSLMLSQHHLHRVLAEIPIKRLLTESDGPFAQLNGQVQRPSSMSSVVGGLATLKGIERNVIAQAIVENFLALVPGP